jgi:hypothetical protein
MCCPAESWRRRPGWCGDRGENSGICERLSPGRGPDGDPAGGERGGPCRCAVGCTERDRVYSCTDGRGGPPRGARDRAPAILRDEGGGAVRSGVECVKGWDGILSSQYSIPVMTPGGDPDSGHDIRIHRRRDLSREVLSEKISWIGNFRYTLFRFRPDGGGKGEEFFFPRLFRRRIPFPARGGQTLIFVAKTSCNPFVSPFTRSVA